MENDLSLSQSFGGLRIANPDDAASSSPLNGSSELSRSVSPITPPGSEPANRPHLLRPLSRQTSIRTPSPLGYANAANSKSTPSPPLVAANGGLRDRRSMPLSHQAQQQQQFSMTNLQQTGSGPPSGSSTSSRPTSAFYAQPSPSPMGAGTYRLRSESSRSSMTAPPRRSSSRSSQSAVQAGVPVRESSYSDRSYQQNRQGSSGNGPLPPRRSSRKISAGHMDAAAARPTSAAFGSPYGIEGGPLPSSEEWKDRGAAMGVQRELDRDGNQVSRAVKKGVKDFSFGRTLGEGSYSTVIAATDRQTLREYAIKVLDKRHIIKEKKVKYVNIEKDTLNRLTEHPGVVRLYYTFQDERSLYFVLDVASGGELLGVLKRMTTFDEECTRFYSAQILDTVDYMHSQGVIHRDLKPENVLLDEAMHVKITDFGTAKILDSPRRRLRERAGDDGIPLPGGALDGGDGERANSFVGTAEYVSPELLRDKNACKASDLWAFGCIVYQLLAGRPPFKAGNEYQTFQKICNLEYDFPPGFPPVARDLVERLLVLEPAKRLPIEHIKNHEFFDGIVWGRGLWKQKPPRLRTYVAPAQEPSLIKLNGYAASPVVRTAQKPSGSGTATNSGNGNGNGNGSGNGSGNGNGATRPKPRIITELPPPSQLDIEWSPVLTRSNERILLLGDLIVHVANAPHSPGLRNASSGDVTTEPTKKLSRFFGGAAKKRQRLVMVTSSARIIMAAAGGEEKKTKTEMSLDDGCTWRVMRDPKGAVTWCVQTHDKLFTFEDPKATPKDPDAATTSAQEWMDTLDRAMEMASSQRLAHAYPGEDEFRDLPPSFAGPVRPAGLAAGSSLDDDVSAMGNLEAEPKSRRRFSKRQSKSGLTAVF
ncbi:MAG: pkb-activating kinase-like protein [Thelocarpon impressellum]|nr:MAG: pkb-activating kinase-like protein [Thelocarpon impressellum]